MSERKIGDPLSAIPASGMRSPTRGAGPVTLGQAAWALMFVAIYIAAVVGVILALGLPGIIDFTLESLLFVLLAAVTGAAVLALYIHLVRRNRLTPADLGFRRLTPRLFHLLWQIPVTIIVCACMQGLSLGLLALTGMDTTTAGAADDPLTDLAACPLLSLSSQCSSLPASRPYGRKSSSEVRFSMASPGVSDQPWQSFSPPPSSLPSTSSH